MSAGLDYRYASKNVMLEYRYRVKAALAFGNKQPIRQFIYTQIAKHYERKHMKEFMSR